MIYLIGGVPRSGKTQVQKYILENYKISGISIDMIRGGFYKTPEFGLNEGMNDLDKSAKLWRYIKGLIETNEYYNEDLVIEGVNLLPIFLSQLKDKSYVRMCFVGYDTMDINNKFQIMRSNKAQHEWTNELTDEELLNLINKHQKRSKELKSECELYGIKYFDTSVDFTKTIKTAAEFLIN